MKKIILLLLITLALVSCERKSGRRPVPEKKLYIIEYVDENVDDIKEIRFADKYAANTYRNSLDSVNIWSRLYSEPINKTLK